MRSKPAPTQKFPLYGLERLFCLTNDATAKSAHMITIESDGMDTVLNRLPEAIQTIWNHHPRTRAVQAQDEVHMAILRPKLTLDQANQLITIIKQTSEEYGNDTIWHEYISDECMRTMDRFNDLPYYVHVLTNSQNRARLILFTDHYMSDGYSCMFILKSLLEEVTNPSGAHQISQEEEKEFIPPSLLERWVMPLTWKTRAIQGFLYFFGDYFTRQKFSQRRCMLPVAKEVKDFSFKKIPRNPSRALFANGKPENLKKLCARCKEEGVTVGGAMYAAVAVAYLRAKYPKGIQDPEVKSIHIIADATYNMRSRLENPLPSDTIGAYVATTQLEFLEKEGIALDAGFWDTARRCKKEMDEGLKASVMSNGLLYLNDRFTPESCDPNLVVPHSIVSDVNISNMGRYPYPRNLEIFGENTKKELKVVAYHRYSAAPWMSPGCALYITSVDYMCYGSLHKHEDTLGQTLFDAFVDIVESMGSIGSAATIGEVFQQKTYSAIAA
jgi:hypothetical protein